MDYQKAKKIIGYHGTDAKNEKNILENNFKESTGSKQWLGNGVYFFIEKILNPPEIDAKNWAIVNAWDNSLKRNIYLNYVVLKAEIKINNEKFLDLDTKEGLEIFSITKKELYNKLKSSKKKKLKNDLTDSSIIEIIKIIRNIEFVKQEMYAQNSIFERINKLFSRIPNICILAVSNPTNNINIHNIKTILKGEI